jgi:nucleotide-binding universal stress UspA family protein
VKKILVPVNPLRESDTVMMAAIAYAKALGASLKVVTLNPKSEIREIKELRRRGLKRIEELCQDKGVKATFVVEEVSGGPEALAERVARLGLGYDMIVMGHFQYDRIYRFVHQSTAQDVMNVTRTPILIVPQHG